MSREGLGLEPQGPAGPRGRWRAGGRVATAETQEGNPDPAGFRGGGFRCGEEPRSEGPRRALPKRGLTCLTADPGTGRVGSGVRSQVRGVMEGVLRGERSAGWGQQGGPWSA